MLSETDRVYILGAALLLGFLLLGGRLLVELALQVAP